MGKGLPTRGEQFLVSFENEKKLFDEKDKKHSPTQPLIMLAVMGMQFL